MRLIYFIMLGIIITSTNLTVYSYDEEDVSYFLKNSKCHQCDLSNYNFEKIGGTNFTNFWKKAVRARSTNPGNSLIIAFHTQQLLVYGMQ